RPRFHVDHVLDAVDLRLEHLGDALLDRLRGRAGIGRGDDHLRRYDVGELGDRQHGHRQHAGDGDDGRNDECESWAADEQRGDVHGARYLLEIGRFARLGATVMPERTRCWPCTMTFSPTLTPWLMVTRSSRFTPVLTRRSSATFLSLTTNR